MEEFSETKTGVSGPNFAPKKVLKIILPSGVKQVGFNPIENVKEMHV